jgi:hypothetical protein
MVLKDQTASLALEHVITLDVKMDQAAGPPAPHFIGEISLVTRNILNNSS